MRAFKNFFAIVLLLAGVITCCLYLFTDWINWNIFGWFSAVLIGIGGYLMTLTENNDSLFKLLASVAGADGEFSDKERQVLYSYAKKFGIKAERAKKLIEEVAADGRFTIPESDSEKKKQIKALVEMAKADGAVDDNELTLIKIVSQRFGLGESYVDSLI